jgi:hypothetical protein
VHRRCVSLEGNREQHRCMEVDDGSGGVHSSSLAVSRAHAGLERGRWASLASIASRRDRATRPGSDESPKGHVRWRGRVAEADVVIAVLLLQRWARVQHLRRLRQA